MLTNHHDQSHILTVTVTADGEIRSDEFTLSSGEKRTENGYISQAGTYTVTVETDAGDTENVEVNVETSEASSTGLTGDALEVTMSEDGTLILSAGIYD